jgi:hypothetical protein
LTCEQYILPWRELDSASIGQHTRHIIELFQCLVGNYELGRVNYDQRQRNHLIETLPDYARSCINEISGAIDKPDKLLHLYQKVAGTEISIRTNYFRELLYNQEHCIHHQALIKVAVIGMENVEISENFGVAPATIEYRKCAQ